MALETTIIQFLLEKLMGKVFELIKDKIHISFEVLYFAFGQWNDGPSSPALLVLVEVTNKSEKPYTISSFELQIGNSSFRNLFITDIKQPAIQGTLLDVTTGDKLRANFINFKNDFILPLKRPYLDVNQSEAGLIIFRIDNFNSGKLEGASILIKAKIAGYDIIVSDRII